MNARQSIAPTPVSLTRTRTGYTSYSLLAFSGGSAYTSYSSRVKSKIPVDNESRMHLVPADEYLIGRISVARYIPPTRLCGGRASFSCVTSPQFAKYHVSRANDRATKGDNARGARYSVEKAVKLMPVLFFHRGGTLARISQRHV